MDKHKTVYDENHERVNFQRVFGLTDTDAMNLDYTATLLAVREVDLGIVWTPMLEDILDAILYAEETEEAFVRRFPEDTEMAIYPYDHGYQALKTLADEGKIAPVYK